MKTHKIYFSESTLKKDFLPSVLLPRTYILLPSSSLAHKFNLINTHLDNPEPQPHFHLSSKSFYLSDNDNLQVPLLNKTMKTTIIQISITALYTWMHIFVFVKTLRKKIQKIFHLTKYIFKKDSFEVL